MSWEVAGSLYVVERRRRQPCRAVVGSAQGANVGIYRAKQRRLTALVWRPPDHLRDTFSRVWPNPAAEDEAERNRRVHRLVRPDYVQLAMDFSVALEWVNTPSSLLSLCSKPARLAPEMDKSVSTVGTGIARCGDQLPCHPRGRVRRRCLGTVTHTAKNHSACCNESACQQATSIWTRSTKAFALNILSLATLAGNRRSQAERVGRSDSARSPVGMTGATYRYHAAEQLDQLQQGILV